MGNIIENLAHNGQRWKERKYKIMMQRCDTNVLYLYLERSCCAL